MTDPDLSGEAKAFIETAEILAEPYQEKIAALRGEIEALTASLHAKDDRTPSAKRSADYWLRMLQACEAERDELRARLEAVRALAEQVHGHGDDSLRGEIERLRDIIGRIAAVALSAAPQPEPERPCWLPADFPTPPPGMHWVHPADGKHSEPEPDRFDCGHWYLTADEPEPPASDEPALHPGIAFWAKHEGHDVGQRHEDGSLLSATCHDCGETYRRSDEPARCEHDFHATNRAGERIGLRLAGAGSSEQCPASGTPDGGS